MLFHTHFLPIHLQPPQSCLYIRSIHDLMYEITDVVSDLQNPLVCTGTQHAFLIDENRHPLALGHGLRWEALMMGESFRNDQIYVPGATWLLFDYGRCSGKGLWCHLEHPSSCASVIASGLTSGADMRATQLLVTHVDRIWPIPERYQPLGLFLWSSSMLGLLMRPRPLLLAKLHRLQQRLGFQRPAVGVHIRYGDGCLPNQLHRPKCEPVSRYQHEVAHLVRQYGARTVFLATDSAAAVAAMTEEVWLPAGVRVVHMVGLDRSVFESAWWIDHRAAYGTVDRALVAESALLDMLMLAHCDALVGSFSSHFSTVALELSTSWKGFIPPHVKLFHLRLTPHPSFPQIQILCACPPQGILPFRFHPQLTCLHWQGITLSAALTSVR